MRVRYGNISIVIFSIHLLTRGGALPRGASRRAVVPNCRFRTLRNPKRGKRSAEIRGRGTPHPLADLTVAPVPPAGGNCRPITRTGAPRGAPLRRFPSTSRPPSGDGQGRPYGTPLIPRAFTRVHPLPPARYRTDPRSWAGRCLPRPPEARLARPNPQAPLPTPSTSATG